MSDQRDGGISWTDQTWNPVRGCSRVSAGCEHCYAETQAARFCVEGQPYHGLVRRTERGRAQWTGTVRVVPEHLDDPLRWKRPRRVFVNSMSDLFHESLSDADIDKVFVRMLLAPHHTFQVLTKRAKRMREYMADPRLYNRLLTAAIPPRDLFPALCSVGISNPALHPAPWIWLGVSCEDQRAADTRIPDLLATPATVRFVSAEPLLGPLSLGRYVFDREAAIRRAMFSPAALNRDQADSVICCPVNWIIVGGESGPNARPCDVAWIRSIVEQCHEAGVACFVKQLGARPVVQHPMDPGSFLAAACVDRKGGDPSEWPPGLRVREFPR